MFVDFLNALPGAVAQGLIWGLMAIGVYISYKILDIADLTVDGSICTGGCVCAVLILAGVPAWISILAAFVAGMLTGVVTGLLQTALGVPSILAGILTQLSLYSVNLLIMMHEGNIVVDVRGEEKKKLTIEQLLQLFEESSGSKFASDKVMLSKK